jgi:Fic family protein
MNSFSPGLFERQPIGQSLLQTIRLLGEYKGRQDLFSRQSPQVLRTLREAAIFQSTEASNRIEGVVAPPDRVRALVAGRTEPRTRSEQEIAGYREVLNTIHLHHDGMDLTPNLVLQLHRDLFQFVPGGGGRWKPTDNQITETRADGSRIVRFTPVPAHAVSDAMAQLHTRYAGALAAGAVEPLLLIPAYVLDFLCIHPFSDGNGRMARLLTLLALYKAGYEVGRYVSLEALVEITKESYYDTLYACSQRWHEGMHTLGPWWEYLLGVVLLASYREFERRVGALTARRGAKRDMIVDAVSRIGAQFKYADLERLLPGVSRPTINRVLRELRIRGDIRCVKPGRDAMWEKRRAGDDA